MITNNKFHVLFYLNKQRQKNGLYPLYIRIYVDSARSEIATTHYVNLKSWDSVKMRLKPSAQNAIFLNGYIDTVQSKINDLFIKAIGSKEPVSAKILKAKLTGTEEEPAHKTILQAYEYHNLKMYELVKVGKVVAATVKRHEITMNKVKKFLEKQYKTSDKPLPEMRLSFVTEFEHFLLTVEKIQSNTAHKYIKNLKKIMNMAVGLDWIPSNPFNNFKCSYHSPSREILTIDELNKIMHKDFGSERMNEVRDVFIFCCYTGFAYSDVYQFENNAVMKGLDGNLWLSTHRQKTGTKESVPLLPIPLEIIAKYQDNEYCKKYNKLLPINSNQRYNAYLKELADICNINKKMTSHIARHTFATTVTLANGVPIETVSAMLGHQNIRTTQIYAKVVEQKVSDDMEMLRAKLFSTQTKSKKVG